MDELEFGETSGKNFWILHTKPDRSPKSPGGEAGKVKTSDWKVIIKSELTAHYLTLQGLNAVSAIRDRYCAWDWEKLQNRSKKDI